MMAAQHTDVALLSLLIADVSPTTGVSGSVWCMHCHMYVTQHFSQGLKILAGRDFTCSPIVLMLHAVSSTVFFRSIPGPLQNIFVKTTSENNNTLLKGKDR